MRHYVCLYMSSFPELSCASNCATYTNVECALLCAFHDTDYTSSANLILYQGSLPLCKLATAVYHRMYGQCDFTSPRVLAIFDLSYAYPYRNTCKYDHVFIFNDTYGPLRHNIQSDSFSCVSFSKSLYVLLWYTKAEYTINATSCFFPD